MMDNVINTVFAGDNNFAPYLLVSINSLFYNNPDNRIRVFVLENQIDEYNKNAIKQLTNNYPKNTIEFIDVSNIDDMLNLSPYQEKSLFALSITAYARLFIASMLPKDVDRVIYFDGDSLINDSIEDLWNTDLMDKTCAGVLDPVPYVYKKVIGFEKEDTYINSGMLLINLKKWRENGLEEKILDFIIKNTDNFYTNDQGIVNYFFKEDKIILHPKYNFQSPFHGKEYYTTLKWYGVDYDYYNEHILKEASEKPVFIHFSGGGIERPWSNDKNYYSELYDFYVNLLDDYDRSLIYRSTGALSYMGKLYVVISSNKIGYKLMKYTPEKFCVWLKNYTVEKQIENLKKGT